MRAFLHTVFAVMLEEEQLLCVCLCLWGAGGKKVWGWSLHPIATGMWAGPGWQQGSSWGLPPRGTKCLGLACLKCACGHPSSASDNRPWTHTHFSFMHNAASYLGLFSLSITSVVWGHTKNYRKGILGYANDFNIRKAWLRAERMCNENYPLWAEENSQKN